jgi:hypothetical protein
VLTAILRFRGALLTGVRWPGLLAFVLNARRTGAGPATVAVVITVGREPGVDLAGALALAEVEARRAREFATLVGLQGAPQIMLCAQTPGLERTVEQLLV